jgi:hypothetical protein
LLIEASSVHVHFTGLDKIAFSTKCICALGHFVGYLLAVGVFVEQGFLLLERFDFGGKDRSSGSGGLHVAYKKSSDDRD